MDENNEKSSDTSALRRTAQASNDILTIIVVGVSVVTLGGLAVASAKEAFKSFKDKRNAKTED